MSDLDPDVIVLTDHAVPDPVPGTAAGEVQAPGSAAMFQGMLSVLGGELESLNRGTALLQEAMNSSRAETATALARLETRLARLEAATGEGRAEASIIATRLEYAAATTRDHLARLEAGVQAVQEAPPFGARAVVENLSPVIEDVNDRVSRLEESLSRLVDQADLRSTTLASELQGVLATGMERLTCLAARTDETTAAELQGLRTRVEVIASSIAGLAAEVTGIAEVSRRLVDEGRARPVLDAIDAASKEQGEVLSALHTSITRRIDARGRAVGEMVEGLSGPLEAVAGLAPGLEEVRSYLGEGLMHVSRRQAGTGKAMESATAALQSMERQLNGLAALCQSLASGAEQQTGASARVADLVLETRAALRGDVDRLEATVHLESLKLHQQDQARLASAASATTEVVEREAALLAQRLSAVAAAVESVRSVLHTHVENASRGTAAPLALVKDS